MEKSELLMEDLLFVGFNGRVIALHRENGVVVWRWQGGSSGQYVCVLPDGDRLLVSCRGYTWALDPLNGSELWHQPLKGEGTGVPSLATMRRGSSGDGAAAFEAERAAQAAASAASGS